MVYIPTRFSSDWYFCRSLMAFKQRLSRWDGTEKRQGLGLYAPMRSDALGAGSFCCPLGSKLAMVAE